MGTRRMDANDVSLAAAGSVSEDRLWKLLMDVAAHGATANGGVNRQALSAEDTAAKRVRLGCMTKIAPSSSPSIRD